ncbi:histidine kinase [Oleiphilus messinensis]|uniref:histidine kinase n=1 Tax=Oleiphilus messinensis TaxID=141451 RepID=A0A1Y0I6P1_9GAMM|nr:YfiR/HmsC family protein [Oleiphilus messinensis]ARU55195.1 histidine kinase [Oleiphilus messinensis]
MQIPTTFILPARLQSLSIMQIVMFWMLLILSIGAGAKETLSEVETKTAFIYRFIEHTTWPEEARLDTIRVGFYGRDEALFDEFQSVVGSLSVRGKAITLHRVDSILQARPMQVVIVSKEETVHLEDISSYLVKTGTLVISDGAINKNLVMINFTYHDNKHLSFEVNKSNIVYEGLTISNDVLLYGGTEIEVATLYKEIEYSLRKIKDQLQAQKKELALHIEEINRQELDIIGQKAEIERYKKDIDSANALLSQKANQLQQRQAMLTQAEADLQQKNSALRNKARELSAAEELVLEKNTELEIKEIALQHVEDELGSSKRNLSERDKALKIKELEVRQLEKSIEKNVGILQALQKNIEQKEGLLKQTSQQVEDQSHTITSQRNVIVIALIALLCVSIAIILKQKAALKRERKLLEIEEQLVSAQKDSIKAYESSLKLKNDFLTAINHELRTPMNGIKGAIETVELDSMDSMRTALDMIDRSSLEMMRLITDILDYTEIQSNQMVVQVENVNIQTMFKSVKSSIEKRCELKDLKLIWIEKEIPGWLRIDSRKVENVIEKLLDNAVKFTQHGEVRFIASCDTSVQPWQLVCMVEDTGPGIEVEYQGKIFDAFQQRESGFDRNYSGLGIGLSICKELLLQIGGDIKVESDGHKGSRFTVCFNVKEGTPMLVDPEQVVDTSLPVLIVEDNPVNQKILQKMLTKLGFDSILANNGDEALKLLRLHDVCLVLMDLQMPVMDGFTCTQEIRAKKDYQRDIPVIAVTANLTDVTAAQCLTCGMNAYLGKPVKLDTLRSTIAEHLAVSDIKLVAHQD